MKGLQNIISRLVISGKRQPSLLDGKIVELKNDIYNVVNFKRQLIVKDY